jgi:hypothetical protein
MKVSFTPKEYARILELLYFAMHMAAGQKGADSPHLERYLDVEQKLLDLAAAFGCPELVDISADGRLIPSQKLQQEERVGKIIGDYDNDTFWHELVHRMADRELATEQAKKSLADDGGPPIDADLRLRELEDGFWNEFEKHDLSHLILLKGRKG